MQRRDVAVLLGLLLLLASSGFVTACTRNLADVEPAAPPGNSALATPEPAVDDPTAPPATTATMALTATARPATPTLTAAASPAQSADADVIFVRAVEDEGGNWSFFVTVSHPDLGWEDYADGWDVVLPDGSVLKLDPASPYTRLLLHPHEDEQPFTRSQSGLIIPAGVAYVTVRAHDLVDGFGGREIRVDLAQRAGEGYEIER